jgi:hypothetical protein
VAAEAAVAAMVVVVVCVYTDASATEAVYTYLLVTAHIHSMTEESYEGVIKHVYVNLSFSRQ